MAGDLYVGSAEQVARSYIGSVFWAWLWWNAVHFVMSEVVPFWLRLKDDKRRYDFVRAFDVELDQ